MQRCDVATSREGDLGAPLVTRQRSGNGGVRVTKGQDVALLRSPAPGEIGALQAQGWGRRGGDAGDSGIWWPGAGLLGPIRTGVLQVFRGSLSMGT